LQRINKGPATGTGGTSDSVCGLRTVAAATDARRGTGRTVVLLAEATRGCHGHAGTADRLPAAGEPELSGRAAALHLVAGSDGGTERVEPARGSDAVHGVDGGVSESAAPLYAAAGSEHRDAGG